MIETTPNGDQILMGEAANQESLASDPRGPANAARSARLLYKRLVEMFPNSPLVPEASWRAADDLWQIEKADASTRSSSKERDAETGLDTACTTATVGVPRGAAAGGLAVDSALFAPPHAAVSKQANAATKTAGVSFFDPLRSMSSLIGLRRRRYP